MRVFVTGATGFIGSATVKELIASRPSGDRPLPFGRQGAALAAAGAEVYRGSIADPDSLKEALPARTASSIWPSTTTFRASSRTARTIGPSSRRSVRFLRAPTGR